ncbi:protein ALP1-like [Melanaphis sacchari]|uniref:protein ALP1-like n=1 Tax=Melanaphis sacchari TaxID=742174 RepID=UPI000DC14AB3|nr:protein ALP1-like [Melanaphis sacchari]
MGGTDQMDENIARHRIGIRGKKWWWSLFTWLIDVSITNSWKLYVNSGHKVTQLEFRRNIVQEYLTRFKNAPKRKGRPSSTSSKVPEGIRFDRLDHHVIPTIDGKRKRCAGAMCTSSVRTMCFKYLTTGFKFVSLGLYFCRRESTLGRIIAETTKIFWEKLNKDWMQKPNKAQWKRISQRFKSLWNLSNCIGSLDGKHIRIEKLPNTDSSNLNYKAYHSIVLLGCSDADGFFTMIETGYAGRNDDAGIFRASSMKYWLTRDEAFPLSTYLMRPYPRQNLNNVKRVFNCRIGRGRKTIECTFGMMTEKFKMLSAAIRCHNVDKVIDIIKSCCILHNFVRKREGTQYTAQHFGNVDRRNIVDLTNGFTLSECTDTVNDHSTSIDSMAIEFLYLIFVFIN